MVIIQRLIIMMLDPLLRRQESSQRIHRIRFPAGFEEQLNAAEDTPSPTPFQNDENSPTPLRQT